jgi:hypothetical protein
LDGAQALERNVLRWSRHGAGRTRGECALIVYEGAEDFVVLAASDIAHLLIGEAEADQVEWHAGPI